MKKMCAVLSVASLMSGTMQAGQINVANKLEGKMIYVQVTYQAVAGGENLTTGQTVQVCSGTGLAQTVLLKGQSQTVTFNSCGGYGDLTIYTTSNSSVGVINTKLGNPVDIKGPRFSQAAVDKLKLEQIYTTKANGNAPSTETYTISNPSGQRGGDLTVTKS